MRSMYVRGLTALVAVLAVSLPAGSATASGPRAHVSTCANALCTKDRASAPSCWRFKAQARVARCFIRRAALHYGQSSTEALAIAHRESRFHWRVVNSSSGALGLYQFMPRTWNFTPYAKKGHAASNPRWAALGAMWMWKHGYKSHWSI